MLSVDKKIAVDSVATVDTVALEKSISSATEALLGYRQSDGHFVFELEADSTLESDYIMMHTLLGTGDPGKMRKAVRWILDHQNQDGGWPIYNSGPSDISATVKAFQKFEATAITSQVTGEARHDCCGRRVPVLHRP